ncbi:SpoIIE family protein phosphatase [Candidatus Poribacteria bacterium]|nr:SpoIIE family protein phosphatase [Candidatus Poribacteria bacterium]
METPAAHPPRVLILQTYQSDPSELMRALHATPCHVSSTFSGDDLLHRVHREKVDLIIVDTETQGADALQVVRDLRLRQKAQQYMPILVLLGAAGTNTRETGLLAGATDFLTRPLHPCEVSNRVAAYLRAKALHDALAEATARLEAERQSLVAVQRGLFPAELPRVRGWEFSLCYEPSGKTSGDYADVLVLPGGLVGFAIGDVRGSGARATVLAASVRAVVRSRLPAGDTPGRVLAQANKLLKTCLEPEEFATLYVGVLDPVAGVLTHATAGHEDPVLHAAREDRLEEQAIPGGPPLGIETDPEYREATAEIPIESRLLLCTNGIWGQRDQGGERFGAERFRDLLRLTGHFAPAEIIPFLVENVSMFRHPLPWEDDVTLLLAARLEL